MSEPSQIPLVITMGPNLPELQIALNVYRRENGQTPGTELLARICPLDEGFKENLTNLIDLASQIEAVMEWARRKHQISPLEIRKLVTVAAQAGESSYRSSYLLMSVVYAASVGNAGIEDRNDLAISLAVTSLDCKQFAQARLAFAEVLESIRLLPRHFEIDADKFVAMESKILRNWEDVRREHNLSADLLDVSKENPAGDLIRLILWNSDEGKGSGMIVQADAIARLIVRLEHLIEVQSFDTCKLATDLHNAIRQDATFPESMRNATTQARLCLTCGDAFVALGQFEISLPFYSDAERYIDDPSHLLVVHCMLTRAYALSQLGHRDEAIAAINGVDFKLLETTAEFVLIMKVELARYLALVTVLGLKNCASGDAKATHHRIHSEVQTVISFLCSGGNSTALGQVSERTKYLRSLYAMQLQRDVEAIQTLATVT